MVRTESRMLKIGTEAPEFRLPDPDGKEYTLADRAPAYLVMFICNHCPFVKHVRGEIAAIGREYGKRGVAVYAINANDVERHPEDAPAKMKAEAKAQGYTFPYLYDADQSVAKAYDAACTPDFYVFDSARRLAYRGQLDGSRPGNEVPVTGRDLRAALDAVLAGTAPDAEQLPSVGCNIKWKPGNAPAWFG